MAAPDGKTIGNSILPFTCIEHRLLIGNTKTSAPDGRPAAPVQLSGTRLRRAPEPAKLRRLLQQSAININLQAW